MTDDDTPVGLPAHDERLYCAECNGVGMCEDVALVGPEVTTRQWRCAAFLQYLDFLVVRRVLSGFALARDG